MALKSAQSPIDEVKVAAKAADTGNFAWDLLSGAGPLLAAVNLPVAVVASVVGLAGSAMNSNQNLKETPMPDSWLAKVANAEGVSPAGLAFLAKELAAHGFISVHSAQKFVEIEERVEAEKKKEVALRQTGAELLLNRAKRDCGDMLEPGLFDVALKGLKSVVSSNMARETLSRVTDLVKTRVGK